MAWPTLTVEIGFSTSDPMTAHASTSWSNVTGDVVSFTTKRGRQDALGRVEAGTATVVLDNTLLTYDNRNASSPYSLNIKPMRKIRIRAVYSAVTYYLFTGYVVDWPLNYGGGFDSFITIQCVDAFAGFAAKKLNGPYAVDYTDDAIALWLDYLGWAAADRQLSTGQSQIQAGTLVNTPALQHFQNVTDVESGILFMDGQGRVTFHDRHYRLRNGSTSLGDFEDQDAFSPSGGDLYYRDVTLDYNDQYIYNEARVTRTGGTEQVATDSASANEFFERTYAKTLPMVSDAEALSLAEWIVSRYAEPVVRFSSMTLDGTMDDVLWPHILGREISDRIHIYQIAPLAFGTAVNAAYCYIEGVRHDVAQDRWVTTFQLSPADNLEYWVLQDAVLGILDSTTRLAY